MFHTQNNIHAMTTDELINGLRNNTIESLQAKDVLRIVESVEVEENEDGYERGYDDGKQSGREEFHQEVIAALGNL